MLTSANVIWGARCGKSARRVLPGETNSSGHAHSVRGARESAALRQAPHGLPPSRFVSTTLLDLWFEKKIRPACQGEAYLTRFADDFVVNFQYRRDAEEFHKNLTDRFGKFGLELAEEKTRVMRFGRFVRTDLEKTGEKPDTFDFLGFKHVCGTDRGGKFALVQVPCDKSRRKFLAKTKEWLSKHRHWKRRDQQKQLTLMLRGFYQYFGLHHCKPKLDRVRREVHRQWARTLRRRSQRHRLYWSYLQSQSWFELPYAVSTLPKRRYDCPPNESNLGSPLREICSAGSARGDGPSDLSQDSVPPPPIC